MTNETIESLIIDLQNVDKPRILSEEKKEFLLTDQQVVDKIISGLLKDLKLL